MATHVAVAGATARAATVAALIGQALACQPHPPNAQVGTPDRLRALAERLAAAQLQIAVVGQFKRGKSSLVNALLGLPVLPTGVVPLTAVTTVLVAGTPRLRLESLDGTRTEREPRDLDALRADLAALVTEEGNPANRLGLLRVEACLPAPLLARGMVLVDTPGIGSTLRHNTEAAIAALPECDVALFVVSPDPPVTEAELAYLAQVRATAARIVVVLNKIDTQEPVERAISLRFLRHVLAAQARLSEDTEIFPLSARTALQAREQGDPVALEASGLPALERALRALLDTEGPAVLAAAVAGKAAALVAALRLDAEIAARAQRLPLAEQDRRIAAFDAGIAGLAAERTEAADRIVGDRARLRDAIERTAVTVAEQAERVLDARVAEVARDGEDLTAARRQLAALVPACFGSAAAEATAAVQDAMAQALRRHQHRIAQLIGTVRHNAASLMEIPFVDAPETDQLDLPRLAAWHTDGRTETLAGLATGWTARLLPGGLRRARAHRQLRAEAAAMSLRNVEALRWSLCQGMDAVVGRFAAEQDAQLEAAIGATRAAMATARRRHDETSGTIETAVAAQEAVVAELDRIERALRAVHRDPAPTPPPTPPGPGHGRARAGWIEACATE